MGDPKQKPLWQRALAKAVSLASRDPDKEKLAEQYKRDYYSNMMPILGHAQEQKMLREQAIRTYGPSEMRRSANRGEDVLFPTVSTLSGKPEVFMLGPTGHPAGFRDFPTDPGGRRIPFQAAATYSMPAVAATPVPKADSPEGVADTTEFLWYQWEAKKRRGENVPDRDTYIKEGITSKVIREKLRAAGKTRLPAKPAAAQPPLAPSPKLSPLK
jgi:hypothetical protein